MLAPEQRNLSHATARRRATFERPLLALDRLMAILHRGSVGPGAGSHKFTTEARCAERPGASRRLERFHHLTGLNEVGSPEAFAETFQH